MEQKSKNRAAVLTAIFTCSTAVITALGHAQRLYVNSIMFDQISAVILIILVTSIIYLFYKVKLIDNDLVNCIKEKDLITHSQLLETLCEKVKEYESERKEFIKKLDAVDAKLDRIILSLTSLASK